MLEQVSELKRIAAADDEPPAVRQHAAEALIELNEDGKVNRRYLEVKTGQQVAKLRAWVEHPDTPAPVREAAERMTFNMPVQGSAADIMKLAMLQLAPALTELGGRLLLQVHDEIVAEVRTPQASEAAERVESIMAAVYPLRVPLVANVGVGSNWLEAH